VLFTDEPVISSLFSKTIHVPFPKYSSLKRICLNLVEENSLKKNTLLNNYFDALVLEAGSLPRKLSNLIREKLIWDGEKASIIINESDLLFFEFESKLLSTITRVVDGDLRKIDSNAVKQDFFIAQVHLWLYKIRGYRHNKFTINEITKVVIYDLKDYPESYIAQLTSLCELLFDRMIEDGFLKKEEDTEEPFNIYYSWISSSEGGDNITGDEDNIIPKSPNEDDSPDFLREFIDFEKYVRGIYIDVLGQQSQYNSTFNLRGMFNELIEKGVISKGWFNSKKISQLIETRNKVVHGMSIENKDLDIIQSSRFDIGRLKAELIGDYTFFVTKKHLVNYSVHKENKGGFDFVANRESDSIVFEVKFLQYGKRDDRDVIEIINKFTNYVQLFDLKSNYVLFFYQPNGRKSYDEFYADFFKIIEDKVPNLKKHFHLFYTSEYRGDSSSGRLEVYLDKVTDKIEKELHQE